MSGIDHLLQLLRKQQTEGTRPGSSRAGAASASTATAAAATHRFLVTKSSWRGSYRRLLCITPTHIITLYPDTLAVTNSWAYAGDHDLAGVEVGGEHGADGGLFTLLFRRDKKGLKAKDTKFACRERAALLSVLYRGVELAVARGTCGLGPTVLGPVEEFRAHKLRKGRWQAVLLRITAHAVERVDLSSGLVKWRLEYRHMASPAARLLAPGEGQPAGQSAFALFGKTGRSPRVYCCANREAALRAMQAAALRKLGLTLAVDSNSHLAGPQLLAAVAAAERERAATAADAPLGEWEVMRVKDLDAGDLAAARTAADVGGWSGVAHRRLVLTHGGLLERRPGDYEVAEWRQLPAVAALVRFAEDPQWLAVEWADGSPTSTYVTPARDALLAAVLDAAQCAAGRPIPVLCQPTHSGDVVVAQRAQAVGAPAVLPDGELEKLCLHQLNVSGKDFIAAGGQNASLAALALAGLSAATSAASLALAPPGTAPAELVAGGGAGATGGSAGTAGMAGTAAGSGGDVGSGAAAAVASGRAGFMHRAFARQAAAVAGNGAAEGASGSAGVGGGGSAGGSKAADAFATFQDRVREFNACVPYAGPQGCRIDDVVILALLAHLPRQQGTAGHGLGDEEARLAVAALHCLQRLAGAAVVASTRSGTGTVAISQIIGAAGGAGRVFAALMSGHDHVAAEAARLLLRFFAPAAARAGVGPWAGLAGETEQPSEEERAAAHASKSVCFISQSRCAALVRVLRAARSAPLLSMAAAEAAAAVVCEPGSQTTDSDTLQAVLQEAAALGRPLFALFSHPAPRVSHAAALIMRAVAEGGAEAAQPMREAALTEGAFLTHLLSAASPQRGSNHSVLSRELVALWADEYSPALTLMKRIFPPGLVRYLNQRRPSTVTQQQAGAKATAAAAATVPPAAAAAAAAPAPSAAAGTEAGALHPPQGPGPLTAPATTGAAPAGQQKVPAAGVAGTPLGLPGVAVAAAAAAAAAAAGGDPLQAQAGEEQRPPSPMHKRLLSPPPPQTTGPLKGNWDAFWAAVQRDHCHAALIWNEGTRGELREALQAEEASLRLARLRGADSASASVAWNHGEFKVNYPSLSKHLCIGGVYVRLLLDSPAASGAPAAASSVLDRLPAPKDFFSAAHHRLLCLGDTSLLLAPAVTGAGLPGTSGTAAAAGVAGSGGGGAGGSQREWEAEGDRELCLRAMTAVYHVHAASIGPVEGISHLLALFDWTPSRALRQYLLLLLEALVAPSVLSVPPANASGAASAGAAAAASREGAVRAAHANGVALMEARGVPLLVDVLAAAHEGAELAALAGQQSNLIAASSHAEESREWWYYPAAAPSQQQQAQAAAMAGAAAGGEGGRVGPVTKTELRQLYSCGAVTAATPFWAAGMAEPLPLAAIRELRWWVARKQGPLSALQAAGVALHTLQALAEQQPAVDATGEVLHPLPLAHRLMASSACLPLIAQVLLTGEPALVSAASILLLTVLQHNSDGLAALYRTGLPFFALAYCGSNLREVSRLLKACHLRSSSATLADASTGRPLAQRSILGGLLPDSLLHILESYGPDQFAAALVGDSDTPELIWTSQMRGQRLVPQMLRHLGDFPRRLRENCHAVYEYTPCPPVGYPEVESEVFCHRYYLKHLCDESRYPGWPLADHVQLLQSLLDAWRAELARQPLSMSETEACRVLGITPGPDGDIAEEELKAAYRRLARLYHPDKNPAGREQFLGVQAAYERLQAGTAGGQGPQPWRILLLLRAQCVLFTRCPEKLEPFKYAGFPLLLQAIALPGDSATDDNTNNHSGSSSGGGGTEAQAQAPGQPSPHFLSAEAAPQLQAATELCWLTCACSRLNGDELTRAGGLRLLGRLLSRCVAVMPPDVAPHQPAAVVATHALRALAVMAAFDNARAELAHSQQLVADIVHCCGLPRAPGAVEAALLCLRRCCASPLLQELLLQRGMLGHVLPLLLFFDASQYEEDQKQLPGQPPALPGPDDAAAVLRLPLVRANAQAAKNLHAQLAVRALAALAGYPPASGKPIITTTSEEQGSSDAAPASAAAASAAAAAAAAAHRQEAPRCAAAQRALAALLTETLAPRLAERDTLPLLTDLNSTVQTPQVIWNSSMRAELLEVLERQRAAASGAAAAGPEAAAAAAAASGFSYEALRGELLIAGVFVRLYTEQPDFPLADPAAFCKSLVTWIYQHQQERASAAAAAAAAGPAAGVLDDYAAAALGEDGQAAGGGDSAGEAQRRRQRHLLQTLRALRLVLEVSPRLLGLLATRTAVDPLLECLRPACIAGLPSSSESAAAAELAAGAPAWALCQMGGVTAGGVTAGASAAELEEAELALEVLLRLTAHAGCIEALSQDKCIAQAYWLAHRAPNTALLMLSLRLLHALATTPACAWGAAAHGGTLYLLTLLLPTYQVPEEQREALEAARVAAASLLSRLAAHPLHGARISLILSKLLPPGLVAAVLDGPGEAAVAALGQSSETPERVWNRSMQRAAAEEVAHLAATARMFQASSGALEWQLPDGFRLRYHELADELAVGGVYVRLFLKDPRHPLRDPKAFLEGLLERYTREVQRSTPGAILGSPPKPGLHSTAQHSTALVSASTAPQGRLPSGSSSAAGGTLGGALAAGGAEVPMPSSAAAAGAPGADLALLLSAAAVALLQAQPSLAEHAVSLGYVEKLVRLLAARVPPLPAGGLTAEALDTGRLMPDEVSGSLLRLLHQLASCTGAAEALARCTPPAVPPLLGALRWGTAASVLSLEALKRALTPTNRWRDALVSACLSAGLVPLLLHRLDWRNAQKEPQGGQEERDASVQRVLYVDVLNLLALDSGGSGAPGAPGERVRTALDASDVWAAYRGQRHDLFLPAGGSHASGVAGLLQGPEASRFALPPALMPPPAPQQLAPAPAAAPAAADRAQAQAPAPAKAPAFVQQRETMPAVMQAQAPTPAAAAATQQQQQQQPPAAPLVAGRQVAAAPAASIGAQPATSPLPRAAAVGAGVAAAAAPIHTSQPASRPDATAPPAAPVSSTAPVQPAAAPTQPVAAMVQQQEQGQQAQQVQQAQQAQQHNPLSAAGAAQATGAVARPRPAAAAAAVAVASRPGAGQSPAYLAPSAAVPPARQLSTNPSVSPAVPYAAVPPAAAAVPAGAFVDPLSAAASVEEENSSSSGSLMPYSSGATARQGFTPGSTIAPQPPAPVAPESGGGSSGGTISDPLASIGSGGAGGDTEAAGSSGGQDWGPLGPLG